MPDAAIRQADIGFLSAQWMPAFGQVNANLMGSTGFQPTTYQTVSAELFQAFYVRDGNLSGYFVALPIRLIP